MLNSNGLKMMNPICLYLPTYSAQILEPATYEIIARHKDYPYACFESITIEIIACEELHIINGECQSSGIPQPIAELGRELRAVENQNNIIISHSSNDQSKGTISWDININSEVFNPYWTGPNGQKYNGLNISGLAPGEYCLNILGTCGLFDPSQILFYQWDVPGVDSGTGCVTISDCSKLENEFVADQYGADIDYGFRGNSSTLGISMDENCKPITLEYFFTDFSGFGFEQGVTIMLSNSSPRQSFEQEITDFQLNNGNLVSQGEYDLSNLESGFYLLTIKLESGCSVSFDLEIRPQGINFESTLETAYHELAPNGENGSYDRFDIHNNPPQFSWFSLGANVCDNICVEECPNWEYIEVQFEPESWETPCNGTITFVQNQFFTQYFVHNGVSSGSDGPLELSAELYNVFGYQAPNCENSVLCIWQLANLTNRAAANDERIAAIVCRDEFEPLDPDPDDPDPDPDPNCPDLMMDLTVVELNSCRLGIYIDSNCDVSGTLTLSGSRPVSGLPSTISVNLVDGPDNLFTVGARNVWMDIDLVFTLVIGDDEWSEPYTADFTACNAFADDETIYKTITKEISEKDNFIISNTNDNIKITHFPNPFTQDITIRIQADESHDLNILITDMIGRKVYEQNITTTNGTNDIIIEEMKDMPHGVYMVRVTEPGYMSENGDNPLEKNFKIIKTR